MATLLWLSIFMRSCSSRSRFSLPRPETNLVDAVEMSRLYTALAMLYRQVGQTGMASSLEARRLELWRHWDSRLPQNSFVGRQLIALKFSFGLRR